MLNIADKEIYCDHCCAEAKFEDADHFDTLIKAAKDAGWRLRKVWNNWYHDCPECTGK
jgi:hypothetical protein